MTLPIATFYYMAFASVASALLAVTRKNPVHSMLWVLVLFLHVAGIFLVLDAEFLAAVQVIVYAGAILIFYLFVMMLLDLPGEEAGPRFGNHWPFARPWGSPSQPLPGSPGSRRPTPLEAGSHPPQAASQWKVRLRGTFRKSAWRSSVRLRCPSR